MLAVTENGRVLGVVAKGPVKHPLVLSESKVSTDLLLRLNLPQSVERVTQRLSSLQEVITWAQGKSGSE